MELTKRDRERLKGVHPSIIRVIERAARETKRPFVVLEGRRTLERQKQLVAKGASTTLNSRHLTGHAVDLAPIDEDGKVSWDWSLYKPLADTIKKAAKAEGVTFEWGGDWKKFPDGPHWQLPWKTFPATPDEPEAAKAPPLDPPKNTLANSRIIKGAGASAIGGAAVMADMADTLTKADGALSAGTWLAAAAAILIVAGAIYALYARWDDAGRPSFFGGA